MEGGKTYVFAVDSQKLKQEWVSLLGGVVKTDNSLLGRKIRSNSSNNLYVPKKESSEEHKIGKIGGE